MLSATPLNRSTNWLQRQNSGWNGTASQRPLATDQVQWSQEIYRIHWHSWLMQRPLWIQKSLWGSIRGCCLHQRHTTGPRSRFPDMCCDTRANLHSAKLWIYRHCKPDHGWPRQNQHKIHQLRPGDERLTPEQTNQSYDDVIQYCLSDGTHWNYSVTQTIITECPFQVKCILHHSKCYHTQ